MNDYEVDDEDKYDSSDDEEYEEEEVTKIKKKIQR